MNENNYESLQALTIQTDLSRADSNFVSHLDTSSKINRDIIWRTSRRASSVIPLETGVLYYTSRCTVWQSVNLTARWPAIVLATGSWIMQVRWSGNWDKRAGWSWCVWADGSASRLCRTPPYTVHRAAADKQCYHRLVAEEVAASGTGWCPSSRIAPVRLDGAFRSVGCSSQWGVPISGTFRSVGRSSLWGVPNSGAFQPVGRSDHWDLPVTGAFRSVRAQWYNVVSR